MIVTRSCLAEPNGIFFFTRRLLAIAAASLSLACGQADSPVGPAPAQDFILDLRYLSTVSPAQKAIIDGAVDQWTRALSKSRGAFRFNTTAGGCFSGAPRLNETGTNPIVLVSVEHVDGAGRLLAYTQVCEMNPRDTLPMLTHIRIDRGDIALLEERGVFRGVVAHELGHALGFVPPVYVAKKLAGGGTQDPHVVGTAARAEFAKYGALYTGVSVPLEDASGEGPNDPHWRFLVFFDEMMSSSIITGYRSPLSAITLGLFQDMGYQVDFSVADPYEVRPLWGGARALPEFSLRNDVRPIAAPISSAFSPDRPGAAP